MISAIDHIGLSVASIDDVKEGLVRLLGLTVAREASLPEYQLRSALLTAGEAVIELVEKDDKSPLEGKPAVIDHIGLRIANLQEAIQRLSAMGVEWESALPKIVDKPGNRYRYIFTRRDSTFGIRVQLVERL